MCSISQKKTVKMTSNKALLTDRKKSQGRVKWKYLENKEGIEGTLHWKLPKSCFAMKRTNSFSLTVVGSGSAVSIFSLHHLICRQSRKLQWVYCGPVSFFHWKSSSGCPAKQTGLPIAPLDGLSMCFGCSFWHLRPVPSTGRWHTARLRNALWTC